MLKDKVADNWCRAPTSDQREMSLDSQEDAVRTVLDKQGLEAPPQYVLKADWTSLALMAGLFYTSPRPLCATPSCMLSVA